MNYRQVERKHSFLAITLYYFFHLSFRTRVLDHNLHNQFTQFTQFVITFTGVSLNNFWKNRRIIKTQQY